MLKVPLELPVLIAIEPIDMRRSFDGLAAHVHTYLNKNPLHDGLFVFRNKTADKIKLFYWNTNGLVIVYKRLEKGKFKWPKTGDKVMSLSRQDLELLLDGIDITQLNRLPSLNYSAA